MFKHTCSLHTCVCAGSRRRRVRLSCFQQQGIGSLLGVSQVTLFRSGSVPNISCILSTIGPKFLPLDSALCCCLVYSVISCRFVLTGNGCVYFYSLQYFCSQTRDKSQICFTNCICCVINLACSFCKIDLKLRIISFTELVFESIDGG